MYKYVLSVVCLAFIFMGTQETVQACTGMFVGKEIASDGRMIIARSEDEFVHAHNKMFVIVPKKQGKNRVITDTGKDQKGFSVSIPDETCKYTSLSDPWTVSDGTYPEICINEYGVAVSATVTIEVSDEYSRIDPFKKKGEGIREAILAEIPACQAKSAEEAVHILAQYIDKYGSAEGNTVIISDKKEAWIFEIYGGYTYAAMRLPQDKAAVWGNQAMIDWVDFNNTNGFVFSPRLKQSLNKMKRVYKNKAGWYHLAKTVAGNKRVDWCNMRTWRGHQVFAPSVTKGYKTNEFYSLLFTPNRKISLFEVMQLFGDRYQGTKFDMSLPKNYENYAIGNALQSEVHIIQTIPELPDETCQIQWYCLGGAEFCPFIPIFSGVTDVYEKLKADDSEANVINDAFFYMSRRNYALAAADREHLSRGLKEINLRQEKIMYDTVNQSLQQIMKQYGISEEAGRKYVTNLCMEIAHQQYQNILKIYPRLSYVFMINQDEQEEKVFFDMGK